MWANALALDANTALSCVYTGTGKKKQKRDVSLFRTLSSSNACVRFVGERENYVPLNPV